MNDLRGVWSSAGASLILSLSAAACGASPSGTTGEDATEASGATTEDSAGTTSDDDGELSPTFWQDVAPIYYERCVTCHRDGGAAPFGLADYAEAEQWASLSAAAVESRAMPPWLIADDGSCNTWRDSRSLSEEQIATILDWVEIGAPEGEPRDDLAIPELPSLEGALTTVMTPEFFPEPEGGTLTKDDEYRCFVLDPGIEQDTYFTGYDIRPGNDALVHHVLVATVDPELVLDTGMTNLESIEALDAESPERLGWPCYALNEGFEPESTPAVWAPGQAPVELPAGSGAPIAAGTMLVVQVHYNMAVAELIGQSDSTAVSLRLEDQVERVGRFDTFLGLIRTILLGAPHVIPGGEPAHEYTVVLPGELYTGWFGQESVELWGLFPHMHQRGTSMRIRVLDGQGEEVACFGDVPRWDVDWQLYYFLDQPITFETDYKLELTCTYDTSDSGPIVPGWGLDNEMCFLSVYSARP